MKHRLLFLTVVCVLLYGWYQMCILPYGPGNDRQEPASTESRLRAMVNKDSSIHPLVQTAPIVW